jgi:hypothetical protein
MSKSGINKTHKAILEDAIEASDLPLDLTVIDYDTYATFVEISHVDSDNKFVIATGLVGKNEENKTSSELLTYLLGQLMFWSSRGKQEFYRKHELLKTSL